MPPDHPLSLLRRLSDTNLASLGNFWGASVESVTDDDNDSERRGSLAGSSGGTRRGSKLSDLLERKKKPEKKRKKDKQGKTDLNKAMDHQYHK